MNPYIERSIDYFLAYLQRAAYESGQVQWFAQSVSSRFDQSQATAG